MAGRSTNSSLGRARLQRRSRRGGHFAYCCFRCDWCRISGRWRDPSYRRQRAGTHYGRRVVACRCDRIIRGRRNVCHQRRVDAVRGDRTDRSPPYRAQGGQRLPSSRHAGPGRLCTPLSAIVALLSQKGITVAPAEYERQIDDQTTRLAFQARVPRSATDDFVTVLGL